MQNKQDLQKPHKTQEKQELFRPQQAAEMLCVTTQTIRAWHRAGFISAFYTVGYQLRIPCTEIERLLQRAEIERYKNPNLPHISYEELMATESKADNNNPALPDLKTLFDNID